MPAKPETYLEKITWILRNVTGYSLTFKTRFGDPQEKIQLHISGLDGSVQADLEARIFEELVEASFRHFWGNQ